MEEQKEQTGNRLLDMDKYSYNVEEMDKGTVSSVVDLARALEKVQLKVVWALVTHIGAPPRVFRCSPSRQSFRI